MSTAVPNPIDVVDFQFKLQCKSKILEADKEPDNHCQLVAAASVYGLVFVGSFRPELKVVQLASLTADKVIDKPLPVRTIPLPSPPLQLAVNCECSILAVDVVINGISFITLYSVPSFLSQTPKIIQTIRLSPEPNLVRSKQLAWNPAIPESLAICLDNGAMSMYVFRDQSFEIYSLDKSQAVQCVCWSPKGKQIVVAHPNYKLVQYKPDLKPARIIQCPISADFGQSFTILAVQWLSTYQFAVSVQPQGAEVVPNLTIVNAPKSNQISVINYDDICYSNYGPRKHHVHFAHIQPWNMILVASTNSMEVGVLATTDTGDTPIWRQYCMADESRAELPLHDKQESFPVGLTQETESDDKEESFPVGLTLETGCTHQLMVGEENLPVMPMIHLVSTHGYLISFNILNMFPNMPGICSPPRPLADLSGQGQFIVSTVARPASKPIPNEPPKEPVLDQPAKPDMSFNIPFGSTSTPDAGQKAKSLFGSITTPVPIKPTFGGNNISNSPGLFAGFGTTSAGPQAMPFGASKPALLPVTTNNQQPPAAIPTQTPIQSQPKPNLDINKPLITVPAKFASPGLKSESGSSTTQVARKMDDEVITVMIKEGVQIFEKELKEFLNRFKNIDIQIGDREQTRHTVKQLNDLGVFSQQATESIDTLRSEIRSLNLSLNESFSMTAEAKALFSTYQNPTKIQDYAVQNQTNRRQLLRLQAQLSNNDKQMGFIHKQLHAQWAEYEDVKKQYTKDRMHVPSLEGVYETLTRQREILFRQRENINSIKHRLGVKLLHTNLKTDEESQINTTVDSLADSILSMTMHDQLHEIAEKISPQKINALVSFLENRPVVVIKPKRPNRQEIKSEVISEKKEQLARIARVAKREVRPETVKPQAIRPDAPKPDTANLITSKTHVTKPITSEPAEDFSMSATKTALNQKPGSEMKSTAQSFFALQVQTPVSQQMNQKMVNNFPEIRAALAQQAPIKVVTSNGPLTVPINVTSNALSGETQQLPFTAFGETSSGLNLPSSTTIQAIPNKPAMSISTGVVNKESPLQGQKPIAFGGQQVGGAEPKGLFDFTKTIPGRNIFDKIAKGVDKPEEGEKPDHARPLPGLITTSQPFAGAGSMFQGLPASSTSTSSSFSLNLSTTKSSSSVPFATSSDASKADNSAKTEYTFSLPKPKPVAVDNKPATEPVTVSTPKAVDQETVLASIKTICAPPKTKSTGPPDGLFSMAAFGAAPNTTITSVIGSNSSSGTSSIDVSAPGALIPNPTAVDPKSVFTQASSILPATTVSPFATSSSIPTTTSASKENVSDQVLPKPDQSVFGSSAPLTNPSQAPSNLSFGSLTFGSAPTTTAGSVFGSPTAATTTGFGGSGGSLFGGSGTEFGGASSIFGGGPAQKSPANSIFGGATGMGQPIPAEGSANLFGQTAPVNPSTIFGGQTTASPSMFGAQPVTSGGSLFGGATAFGASPQQSGATVFGGGTLNASPAASSFSFASAMASPSVFGGGAQSTIFGGDAGGQQPFGATSPPSGLFAQANASAEFGSNSPFQKPAAAFGGPPVFGAQPTFGATPAFGSGFGSPVKDTGFGGFAATSPTGFGAPSTGAQNKLFDALGSSDTGLSFGNLAQSNNNGNQNQQFGGSAFSSWR